MPVIDPIASYARSYPQNQAVVDLETGRRWTYAELHDAVDRLAAWLVLELGQSSSARIATLSKNCAEMLMLQHAGVRAGAIFVPLNWRLAPAEIEVLAEDAGPEIVFHDEDHAPPAAAARTMPISQVSNLGSAGSCPPPEARLRFDDVATLLYTSGTSGRPKGVMLSEENIFWGCANFIYGHDVTMQSVFLCDMPLFHTAGLFAAARVPIQAGASVLISKGFDAPTTLSRLTDPDLNVSHYFSVPQMSAWIWNEPGFDARQLRKLSCWAIGGAPNPRANAERFIRAGIRIADGFGMSEICSGFGMPPQDPDAEGMKGRQSRDPVQSLQQTLHPETHFLGRLVGEGDPQDLSGMASPPVDQVGDLAGDDPCLSASGAGHHEHGTIGGGDGQLLPVIQSIEVFVHETRMTTASRAEAGGLWAAWIRDVNKGPGKGLALPALGVNLLSADWKTQLTRSTNSSIPARESLWVDL